MDQLKTIRREARKDLFRLGCAGATCKALNRSFGYTKKAEEKATAPLCGGILQKGYQCGMMWGAALAAGTASYTHFRDTNQATTMAMHATRQLMETFSEQSRSVDCRGITGCDWTKRWGSIRYFLTGKTFTCLRLLGRWTTEAFDSAHKSLSGEIRHTDPPVLNCASMVIQKMEGTLEQQVMVAGFAGGIGLSGYACGALGAAIWMLTLRWQKENPNKGAYQIPEAKKLSQAFEEMTRGEYLCHRITGKEIVTIGEHTFYIREGGCKDLITLLVDSSQKEPSPSS